MTAPAIETNGLTRRYGALTAVDHLNIRVEKGELFALLGVNGAGKTTTIRMLCCLTKPTEGDATLSGASIVREPMHVKEKIGVSPQETAVAANLTAEENLRLMCGMHGLSRAETDEKVRALSERFHLNEVLSRRAGKLSAAGQRRLSIAMALVSDPEILFLDEPTLGLDVIARSVCGRDPRHEGARHHHPDHPLYGRSRSALRPRWRDEGRPPAGAGTPAR